MPRVSAQLSVEARRGWDRFLTAHGVTLSGYLEAVGQLLDERTPYDVQATIDRARKIDKERGSR